MILQNIRNVPIFTITNTVRIPKYIPRYSLIEPPPKGTVGMELYCLSCFLGQRYTLILSSVEITQKRQNMLL